MLYNGEMTAMLDQLNTITKYMLYNGEMTAMLDQLKHNN